MWYNFKASKKSMEQTEDPLGTKRAEKVVYIFNMSEDVWPFISAISDVEARRFEVEENANLADRELFSISDENDAVFVSPKKIHPAFLEYYKKLFNIKNITIIVPKVHTGVICEDIVNDPQAFEQLVYQANSVKKLTLIAYSTSHQFLHLVDELRNQGIAVYTPESPEKESVWTVNFYGSKSGIRQLAQQGLAKEPDLLMPEGLICANIFDAAEIAANKYIKEDGVVIKTNKGHSGAGVLIFRPGELPKEYHACFEKIYEILKKDKYWEMFPIVIEDYINVSPTVGGGFPNVEFKILKSGKIEFLYFCGLRVSKQGVFAGVEINDDVMTDRIATRIMDTGFFIGEQYASEGYRGYFDVDFVAAKNGQMYVTESNVRRTGGTYVYQTAYTLIGKDLMTETYVLSSQLKLNPEKEVTFEQLHNLFIPILFNKKTKEGVVIASENLLHQKTFGYIVFGTNKKRALDIESQMLDLMKKAQFTV